jgi:NADP-dependent 3-hydroxy acid dehydrogenase YdfG
MPDSLENRIAFVTGASAGIGEACVRDLVAQGVRVVINARRAGPLEALARELGPDRVALAVGDCSRPETITAALDTARSRFGKGEREADLVIVNAGRGLRGSVMDSDPAQWEQMVRTNITGAALLIREAGRRMLSSTEGRSGPAVLAHARDIVVLGSTVGRHISPFSSMYGSTKFAVNSLAEAARRELGPKGIRVTLVEPGFVVSEFQGVAGYDPEWFKSVVERIGPVLTPADVARTIRFIIAQPAAVHINDIVIRPTRQDYP